jgi:uncharacterized DUF497 family protein
MIDSAILECSTSRRNIASLPTPPRIAIYRMIAESEQAWTDGFRYCNDCVIHIYTARMDIEFDADKDEVNRFKHRLSLAFGKRIFDDPDHVITPTIRIGDEEERHKAIGQVDGKLYTAIHVWRGDVVRMISVRRSNSREQRNYDSDPG